MHGCCCRDKTDNHKSAVRASPCSSGRAFGWRLPHNHLQTCFVSKRQPLPKAQGRDGETLAMSDFHGLYPFGSPLFGGLVKDTISSRAAALADILCSEYFDQIARVQIILTFMISAIVLKAVAVDGGIIILELGDDGAFLVLNRR